MEYLELRSFELELAAKREAFRREHERDLVELVRSEPNAREALAPFVRGLWSWAGRPRRGASARSLAAE